MARSYKRQQERTAQRKNQQAKTRLVATRLDVPWSTDDVLTLVRRDLQGHTTYMIALELRRTYSSVSSKRNQLRKSKMLPVLYQLGRQEK